MLNTKTLRKAGKKLTRAEAAAGQAFGPYRETPLVKLLSSIGKVGDQPELRGLSAVAVAVGLLTSNRRLVRAGVRMILAHELATLAKDIVKRRIDRTRPRSAKAHAQRKLKPGAHTAKEKTSFPSGHSAGAVAVARAFSREYPDYQAPALASAGVVAAAQIPKLAHYPTDVGAGMLLGTASELAADFVMRAGERLEAAITPEARPRPRLRA